MLKTGQYLDIALSLALIFALVRLKLQIKYLPIAVFVVADSFSSLLFLGGGWLVDHHLIRPDYRIFWCVSIWLGWITTLWLVYALLIAILEQLPGIRKFSLRLMTLVILGSFALAILTIGPEYAAAKYALNVPMQRLTVITAVINRALCLAELLAILAILAFVLRFPIRVPRNLAAFSTGLSCYLFCSICIFLFHTYGPRFARSTGSPFNNIPAYLIGICMIYWLFSINLAGEESQVTLGHAWKSVPKEHLVRQLEAMNAALLQSREQV
jgi:hypothetical protein